MKNIAAEIRRIRKAMDWNQAEFAEAIGASQGSVSKWERGLEAPRAEALLKIGQIYEIEERNTEGALFDFDTSPTLIDVPLTGALLVPSDEDIYSGVIKPLGMLRLPRPVAVKGPVIGWGIPRLSLYSYLGYKPGQIIFTRSDTLSQPEDGDKVVIQEKTQDGSFLYSLKFYGSSEKGFEWFTSKPQTSSTVPFDDAMPIGKREEHNIFPVGVIFASFGYESGRQRFWDQVWERGAEKYSETNF